MFMYKQIIVVNKDLGMSAGKLASQVSHASMAFLSKMIQNNTVQKVENRYSVWANADKTKPQWYMRSDLHKWAEAARERGDDYFYARPIDPSQPYGELELCDPDCRYECHMNIDKDLFEQWMGGIFTKVILEAKNENQMKKIAEKAKESGMTEDVDFFCVRDCCLTELTPDETGTRWTCIGFRPMEAEKIDVVTKKLQLYKG
jgi:PTH2 family peptidyl-tRNA hydrolase